MAGVTEKEGSYIVQFTHQGRRRVITSGKYKPAAVAMASRIEALIELLDSRTQPTGELRAWVDGLESGLRGRLAQWGMLDGLRAASGAEITEHLAAYLDHLRLNNKTPFHIAKVERCITALFTARNMQRLADITADAVEAHLQTLKAAGMSAATLNTRRAFAVSFCNWAVKKNRLASNPLRGVAKQNEDQDRRRIRRALSDEELAKLLAVAKDHGRTAWYVLAAMAGLRRGDLLGIEWRDVDLAGATLTIRATVGKAKRKDVIPLHPQAVTALTALRPKFVHPDTFPMVKVFPSEVQPLTVRKDFLRAGLARWVYTDGDGKEITKPAAVALRKTGKPYTARIDTADPEGRVLDLHALRTTLGTRLARAGVAPQIAQRIMRHSDYRTTLKHYTVLGLADSAAAVNAMPLISDSTEPAELQATGTTDAALRTDSENDSATLSESRNPFILTAFVEPNSGTENAGVTGSSPVLAIVGFPREIRGFWVHRSWAATIAQKLRKMTVVVRVGSGRRCGLGIRPRVLCLPT
jgi:integrase